METGAKQRRNLLNITACVTALGITVSAHAQTNPKDQCREAANSYEEHIACLETVIDSLIGTSSQSSLVLSGPKKLDDGAPAGHGQSAKEERLDDSDRSDIDAPVGLGAEQVIAKQERETKEGREQRKKRLKSKTVNAKILDFARTGTGRLIFVLDNGQVWAQRSGDKQKVRLIEGGAPEVTIRRGAFSGYRMEISKPNRTIVVERLK